MPTQLLTQTLDSMTISIGQQAHLRLSVLVGRDAKLQWPDLKVKQQITPGVEVVAVSEPDTNTVNTNSDLVVVERTWTLTAWEQGLYAIPALTVQMGGQTIYGQKSALKVLTVDVDTLHPNQFYPAKEVQSPPMQWSEWRPLMMGSFLIICLVAAVLWAFIRLQQQKPVRLKLLPRRKKEPAHQRALTAIGQIKQEQMAASGDQKAYYTRLTDTLRRYMEERFHFSAMEMTSDEIIARLEQEADVSALSELRDVLRTADLVKFAKHAALLNENDRNLLSAIHFIDKTKQTESQETLEPEPTMSQEDKQSLQLRKGLKIAAWVAALMAAALAGWMVYSIWQLSS